MIEFEIKYYCYLLDLIPPPNPPAGTWGGLQLSFTSGALTGASWIDGTPVDFGNPTAPGFTVSIKIIF